MKIFIKKNYSFSNDLYNLKTINTNYDLGEAKDLFHEKTILHTSSLSKSSRESEYFFDFFTSTSQKTNKILIYVNSINFNIPQSSKKMYYYLKIQSENKSLTQIFEKESVPLFDHLNLIKKSHLSDWSIYVTDPMNLSADCCVINSFLSLGATIQCGKKINQTPFKTFNLSFQHGINLYMVKK